jgi:anti-sigma-K factor RskA
VTEHVTRHEEVAGYLLGSLSPNERAAFEQHLAQCASCREQVRELGIPAELLARAVPAYEVPSGLAARTLSAIDASAGVGRLHEREPAPRRRPWRRSLALAPAAAALIVGAFFGASQLDRPGGGEEVELEAVLAPPEGGSARATVVVSKTSIGRVVSFSSNDLPILPKGEYYELWFVGPGDTLGHPNRISAGTFHPDEQGRSRVELTAAVDPLLYPALSVTAEPADGNPQRTGPEVLRSGPG